jgi:hypothetical protein
VCNVVGGTSIDSRIVILTLGYTRGEPTDARQCKEFRPCFGFVRNAVREPWRSGSAHHKEREQVRSRLLIFLSPVFFFFFFYPVLQIRIRRIRMFLGLLNPDPRGPKRMT